MTGDLGRRICVACGGADSSPWGRGLVTCSTCGLVYYPRRLGADEIARLYGTAYFRGEEYFDYLADRGAHQANFRRRARRLLRWLPQGRRLFEIGCSYGLFLDAAREFWDVRGCDVAEEPCRHARENLGLDVVRGDFRDVPMAPGGVDAVCLWDTVEHLDDPGADLARAAEVLPPGGILSLTTGDLGSLLARVRGPRWRQIHPPTHLWYFSRATMARTLDRFGFDVIEFRSVGVSRSLAQIVYGVAVGVGKAESPAVARLVHSPLGRVNVWMNTFDLMMVVARRRPAAAGRRLAA